LHCSDAFLHAEQEDLAGFHAWTLLYGRLAMKREVIAI
jgi:hypothetical protein